MISGIAGFAYDCKDADALSDFYVKLLGWEKFFQGMAGQGYALLKVGFLRFRKLKNM